ncbi:MAG: site-specific DNA-methyltransferase [Dermatophilaceae bacterium]
MPDASVDCIITSPPYFRLRDYGVDGQLGLETHVDDWVRELRAVSRALQRVLVDKGTMWLNLGDTYSTHPSNGAARKSLVGAPERLLLALIDDGWIVRNKVVWAKTNPMPTSVTDRLSTTYEVVYLLVKSPRYFFDLDAIREPHRSLPAVAPRGVGKGVKYTGRRSPWLGPNSDGDSGLVTLKAAGRVGHPLGKNPGDVWRLSTARYKGAHFATFPETLVERMIRAGCPPGGLILDPFMGAGTTAVVAERLGRDWVGIELSREFRDQAERRIEAARDTTTTKRKEVA